MDFNQLSQQFNASKAGQDSPGEATTPEKLIEGGAEKTAQTIGKLLAFIPTGSGAANGYAGETNVFSGMAMSASALLSSMEARGGVVAALLKYFTRDLPKGLADDVQSGGGGDAFASGSGTGSGFSDTGGGDMASMGGMGNMGGGMADFGGGGFQAGSPDYAPEAVSYGGKLLASGVSDMVDFSPSRLGDLSPPPSIPGVSRGGVDAGMSV